MKYLISVENLTTILFIAVFLLEEFLFLTGMREFERQNGVRFDREQLAFLQQLGLDGIGDSARYVLVRDAFAERTGCGNR